MTDKSQLLADFGVNNGYAPGAEGPRAFGYTIAFPGGTAPVLVDLTLADDLGFIDKAQGIFIDNTGAVGIALRIPGVEQIIRIPPLSQYTGPIALPRDLRTLLFTSNEAKSVRIIIFNVPLPLAIYNTTGTVTAQITGTVTVQPVQSATATRSNVGAAAADTLILASNAARDGGSVFNDSASATLYLSLGTGAASLTSYSVAMTPQSYFEIPYQFTGELRGIWSAAVGAARVTEYT
jgi:hypothetical protein